MSILVRFVFLVVLVCCCACSVTGYGAKKGQVRRAVYYVVQRGDTLNAISRRYGVATAKLVRLNGLRSTEKLDIGQRLLVGYRTQDGAIDNRQSHVQPVSARNNTTLFATQGRLGWPVNTGYMASAFGPRNDSFHDGIDFAAPEGSPIFAAHRGQVAYADNDISGYGNLILIRGDDRLITVYAHNSELLVRVGQRVQRGERIAEVGSTGRASGPHLHFEVRARDSRGRYVAVDPYPLLSESELKTKPRYRVNENLFSLMAKMFQ